MKGPRDKKKMQVVDNKKLHLRIQFVFERWKHQHSIRRTERVDDMAQLPRYK